MFVVNEDLSIYATRGDIVFFTVTADDNGYPYRFQPGDILRMAIYGRKEAESCVMQKDFAVEDTCDKFMIFLEEEDTKIGEIISKPKDYWYEVVLNPDTQPQTIIGYDENGPKVFKLMPESEEKEDNYKPNEEDFPVVDSELDMLSPRPVANSAIARALASIMGYCETIDKSVANLYVTPEMFGAIGDGEADDSGAITDCLDFAEENGICVRFLTKVYGVAQTIVTNLPGIIYGNNAVLKALCEMRCVFSIKNPYDGSEHNGCHAVYDLNIDGNSLADKCIIVEDGKGITLKNIRAKAAKTAQMQIGESGTQVWELNVENVELRCALEEGYSPYGLLILEGNTDSYYRNILIINSSQAWVDSASAACSFADIHGYGYPAELAADTGFVFRGNGNFVRGLSVDTPMNKGIVVDGDHNVFSDISVGNMQSETGRGIEVNGTANTFDGVRCSSYYCFYITSGENTVEDFKCLRLWSKSTYDYYFTGKLPYRGVFDTKTEVTNNIKRFFVFKNQWFYQSVLTIPISFGIEHRYANYDVHVVGVEVSAPKYGVTKSTTGCEVVCGEGITSGRKVNIIIDSPSVTLI